MNRIRFTFMPGALILGAFVLCPASVKAQTTPAEPPIAAEAPVPQETPEQIATAYMNATRKSDFGASAQMMHPAALQNLRKLFTPMMTSKEGREYGQLFFQVNSVAEFNKLTDVQLFERLMKGVGALSPDMKATLSSSQFQVIGHVPEAPDLAHVVYRTTMKSGAITVTKTTAMSLRQSDQGWRVLLTGDIEGLAQAFSNLSEPAPKPVTKSAPKPKPPAKSR